LLALAANAATADTAVLCAPVCRLGLGAPLRPPFLPQRRRAGGRGGKGRSAAQYAALQCRNTASSAAQRFTRSRLLLQRLNCNRMPASSALFSALPLP